VMGAEVGAHRAKTFDGTDPSADRMAALLALKIRDLRLELDALPRTPAAPHAGGGRAASTEATRRVGRWPSRFAALRGRRTP
jgi:hypothetical protein